nr:putative ribonuclease H-like domain-containing protein [Tanacetum cinerariifolium]
MNVSPTPTTRIHTIHPKTQILGDPLSAVQTRSKVHKNSEAHALISYIQKQQRNNHKDFQHCLFACFLSQVEPKKISQALEDKSWGGYLKLLLPSKGYYCQASVNAAKYNDDDLEEMDLKWQGHFARDYIAKWNQDSRRRDGGYNKNKARDISRRPASQDDSKALVIINGEAVDWFGHVEEDTQNFALMAYSSSNSGSDNEV